MSQTGMFEIRVSNSVINQFSYIPIGPDTDPGYGVILNLDQATVQDANNVQIWSGATVLRIKTSTVTPLHATMITRMVDPFQGMFEIDIQGTFNLDAGATYAELLADSLLDCILQGG
jgi:hypothetical protein